MVLVMYGIYANIWGILMGSMLLVPYIAGSHGSLGDPHWDGTAPQALSFDDERPERRDSGRSVEVEAPG